MLKVGVFDFCLRDLTNPDAVRLRRILSGVINFAKFREERLLFFDQCTQKIVLLLILGRHLRKKSQFGTKKRFIS